MMKTYIISGHIAQLNSVRAVELIIDLARYFKDIGCPTYHVYTGCNAGDNPTWKMFVAFNDDDEFLDKKMHNEMKEKIKSHFIAGTTVQEDDMPAWHWQDESLIFKEWANGSSEGRWVHLTKLAVWHDAYYILVNNDAVNLNDLYDYALTPACEEVNVITDEYREMLVMIRGAFWDTLLDVPGMEEMPPGFYKDLDRAADRLRMAVGVPLVNTAED